MANYDYASMPNSLSGANSEVATLMYDLGVAVDMIWSGSNSTSFFSSSVLKEYYAYSPKIYATATFMFGSTTELIVAIQAEMDAGRPVFAKGGGHFYLIDGYNLSNEFHMNFGWGGTYDGYYPIDNVSNGAGTFTPSNFIFNIMPMNADLEAVKDTIYISANGVVSESVEFSSTLDWTASTSDSWIALNLASGTKGYYNHSDGSIFASPPNQGVQRIGYISLQNATTSKTLVIVQEASPLGVTPNPVNFTYAGGSEIINVTLSSWLNWTATASETWLSLTPNSGTGNGAFTITSDPNLGGMPRVAYVLVEGGVFTDSIPIFQDAENLLVEENKQNTISIYPNPTTNYIHLTGEIVGNIILNDILGNSIAIQPTKSNGETKIDLSSIPSGLYFLQVNGKTIRLIKQ